MEQFKRVGAEVAFGNSLVGLDDVRPIHDMVVGDLLLAARAPRIGFTEARDSVAYSFYFRPLDDMETTLPDRMVSVQMGHESSPDGWWLSLNLRTFVSEQRHSSKRIRYRFEALGDDLLEAKKTIYFILGNAAVELDPHTAEPIETITTEYKMYEKPLQLDDCEQVIALLYHTAGRALASRAA